MEKFPIRFYVGRIAPWGQVVQKVWLSTKISRSRALSKSSTRITNQQFSQKKRKNITKVACCTQIKAEGISKSMDCETIWRSAWLNSEAFQLDLSPFLFRTLSDVIQFQKKIMTSSIEILSWNRFTKSISKEILYEFGNAFFTEKKKPRSYEQEFNKWIAVIYFMIKLINLILKLFLFVFQLLRKNYLFNLEIFILLSL